MTNELNIAGLFPVPIASTQIDLPDTSLIEWKYESDFKQSVYDLHTLESWQPLCANILEYATLFLSNIGYEQRNLFITQMWANEYPIGAKIPPHVHSNSLLSGCIYFDNNSPTVFHNHRQKQLEMVQVPVNEVTPYTSEVFTVEAKAGRLVLFPSWLVHSSGPAVNDRLTVSFNLMPRELGKPSGFNYVNLENC